MNTKVLKGRFCDNLQGLEYSTPTRFGITNNKGEFEYLPGETVTFAVGDIVLGSATACEFMTPAHLVIEVGGMIKWIKNHKVTNVARLLQSLARDRNIEDGIVITDDTRIVMKRYKYKIDLGLMEDVFTEEPNVKALFAELKTELRSPAQARNHLRRTMNGIRKLTDVKVPTRDGAYLLADVYLPIGEGKYPVVMSLGGYGKAFWRGCICNGEDLEKSEQNEDAWFEGARVESGFIEFHLDLAGEPYPPQLPPIGSPPNPSLMHVSEYFERGNTLDWVPRGYVLIMVDGRGTGRTPGMFEMFSRQEAEDYYDAIEWAGKQPWSSGNVGLYGGSYYAINAFNVASLQPPSLKAMIPVNGDCDSYRDCIYTGGGLLSPFPFIAKCCCGEWKGVDYVSIAKETPFCDSEGYGPEGKVAMSSDTSKITVPFWTSFGLELPVHTRGSSEAYINCASKHKKLTIISEPGIHFWVYPPEFLNDSVAFFDYWLKGIDNGIMDRPPVRMQVRAGWGGYYYQDEQEWPIARTQYTKFYLNGDPSALMMEKTPPAQEHSSTYKADDPEGGIFFLTEPMAEDTVIAGYVKGYVWVSSTSHDMALKATMRVMDENNVEVPYAADQVTTKAFYGGQVHPLAKGAMKVSHRKLDPEKSTIYRPYFTHQREDYQPLSPGEVVDCEVEFWPTTALVKKGWRIRLDLKPGLDSSGQQFGFYLDPSDQTYIIGASNSIYTGPEHQSYLQLPIIPPKS